MAIALLPGNVAVAVRAQTLEDLIDARSEREPLTQNPLFRRTLQHPHAGRSLLTSYGEVAAIGKFILRSSKPRQHQRLALVCRLWMKNNFLP
jgi:hypothetical protein